MGNQNYSDYGPYRNFPTVRLAQENEKVKAAKIANDLSERYTPDHETAAQLSARNIAEQKAYQDRLNSQWVPPASGGGAGTGWGSVGRKTTSELPVYDTNQVEALAQRVAAPGIRRLRNEVQNVQGSNYENPNVKSMTLRSALEGYGSGLESVMGGAFQTGSGMYNQEYQPKVTDYMQSKSISAQERMQQSSLANQRYISSLNSYNRNR